MNSEKCSLTIQSSNEVAQMQSKEQFLALYHPQNQERYTRDQLRCVAGNAPTLEELNRQFGEGMAQEWLTYQIIDFSEFCGVRQKITAMQLQQVAMLLTSEYKKMKVTDFMLFFRRFKLGYYGQLFGAFDPLLLTNKFLEYKKERSAIIIKMREKEQKDNRNKVKSKENYISYEEWQNIKQRKQSS